MKGEVVGIFKAAEAGATMQAVDQAELKTDRGLVGDRYYAELGTFSAKLRGTPDTQVTLIEAEAVEAFNGSEGLELAPSDLRRNIVTRGIRLNDLVGRQFSIGAALLEGIRLCEPCAYLAETVDPRVLPGLVHAAGLRARIVSGGVVCPGDAISGIS